MITLARKISNKPWELSQQRNLLMKRWSLFQMRYYIQNFTHYLLTLNPWINSSLFLQMIFAQNDEWSVFSQSLRLPIFSFVLFFSTNLCWAGACDYSEDSQKIIFISCLFFLQVTKRGRYWWGWILILFRVRKRNCKITRVHEVSQSAVSLC